MSIHKVLIANRGEIAVRVIRACHDLGIRTVAIYSQADAEALHVLHADEAVCIGPANSEHSYLKVSQILAACEVTSPDSVHPGYGFLSENANFASICETCGLNFIGPSPDAIQLLGDKARAKEVAREAGCPVIPGSEGVVENVEKGLAIAKELGFPILIKASGGGGGKGIRLAENEAYFAQQFKAAQKEAEACFSNASVYLEKLIKKPRHIEVQIIGDQHGNYLHFGERDCTIQRRRQKLIEEAPSPILSPILRQKMGKAAVAVAKSVGYYSVGTVEFLLDEEQNFYFMEVNTRIQVEHTVTEELTGVDLVKEQLRVAMGEKLTLRQKDISFEGHAIQFRINAENPAKGFSPSPGVLEYYLPPGGPHVRVDSSCYSGCKISPHYDSMIAKLIVRGHDRKEALAIARRALREFHIGGIHSTVPFHLFMVEDEKFLESDFDLHYVDELIAQGCNFNLSCT